MKNNITKSAFEKAEIAMNELLRLASKKGGFDKLTKKESLALNSYTQTVKEYEDLHYKIEMPQTVQGLIELKMYERKLKQKELAALLDITETKLSEIMNHKRKPSLSFIKALNQILEIDGDLLLKIA